MATAKLERIVKEQSKPNCLSKAGSDGISVDLESLRRALVAAQGAEIDSELFRFLIQMTALEAKVFCG